MDKKEFLERLNWITPNVTNSKADVSITVTGSKKDSINITIRNGLEKRISKTGFVKMALFKNKIIFAETTERDGFTCRKNQSNKQPNVYIKFALVGREWLQDFVGDYQLKTDEFYDFYYIEKEK